MRKIAALLFLLLLAPTLAFATEQSSSTQKPTATVQKSATHKPVHKKHHAKSTKKSHKSTKNKTTKQLPTPNNNVVPTEPASTPQKKSITKKKSLANNQTNDKDATPAPAAATSDSSNKKAAASETSPTIKTTDKASSNQVKKANKKQVQASTKAHKLARNKTHKQLQAHKSKTATKTHLANARKPAANRDDDEDDDDDEPAVRTTQLNNADTYTDVNKRLQSDTDSPSPRFSSSSTTSVPNSKIHNLMEYATSFVGARYRFGGSSPSTGFDCSGYVKYVFQNQFGISLPHNAAAMSRIGKRVAQRELRPGDLVLFTTLRRSFGHVGIYIGNNRFIHAASSRTGIVEISSLDESYWARAFRGGRRLAVGSDYSDY